MSLIESVENTDELIMEIAPFVIVGIKFASLIVNNIEGDQQIAKLAAIDLNVNGFFIVLHFVFLSFCRDPPDDCIVLHSKLKINNFFQKS